MDLDRELAALDRLVEEVRRHAWAGDPDGLVHALRNLSHVAALLGDVVDPRASLEVLDAERPPRAS